MKLGIAYVLIGKECAIGGAIPFGDDFLDDLPKGLPPLCDTQHKIDLVLTYYLDPVFQNDRIIK